MPEQHYLLSADPNFSIITFCASLEVFMNLVLQILYIYTEPGCVLVRDSYDVLCCCHIAQSIAVFPVRSWCRHSGSPNSKARSGVCSLSIGFTQAHCYISSWFHWVFRPYSSLLPSIMLMYYYRTVLHHVCLCKYWPTAKKQQHLRYFT